MQMRTSAVQTLATTAITVKVDATICIPLEGGALLPLDREPALLRHQDLHSHGLYYSVHLVCVARARRRSGQEKRSEFEAKEPSCFPGMLLHPHHLSPPCSIPTASSSSVTSKLPFDLRVLCRSDSGGFLFRREFAPSYSIAAVHGCQVRVPSSVGS
jgi:hypothetical protein